MGASGADNQGLGVLGKVDCPRIRKTTVDVIEEDGIVQGQICYAYDAEGVATWDRDIVKDGEFEMKRRRMTNTRSKKDMET